jgi:hypothetical protein
LYSKKIENNPDYQPIVIAKRAVEKKDVAKKIEVTDMIQ